MKKALCLTAFIFHCIFKFATSLVPVETALSDPIPLPISTLPTHLNNNTLVVVTCDGSMSLVDLDSNRINWTFKSGVPIYSSYQAPDDVGTYIDVGLDWKLYLHDKTKGISKMLDSSVKDFISETPFSLNGTTVIGQMKTSVTILNAKTGKLVHTLSPLQLGFDGENPMLLGESYKPFLEPGNSSQEDEGAALIYITRIDYSFMAYSEDRSVAWNFMYSDVTTEIASGSYKRSIIVYRIRDSGYPGHPSLVGSVDRTLYSLPGYKELVLYSAKHANKQLSIPEQRHAIVPYSGVKQELLALTSFESIAMTALALPINDTTNEDTYARQPAWLSVIFLSPFLVLIIVFAIYHYFVIRTSNKQDKDLKLKPSATKRRKTRKLGTGKNNVESEGSSVTVAYPSMSLNGLISRGHMEGRQIGKLYISSKEIARGSNGTVVLEGIYDTRPVAVKRLVQTHHDVALKEIQNLIASDQHPNIVRWYGMEFDSDFVYLSLERCTCNLNDLIYLYSRSPKVTTSEDSDSYLLNDYFVQVQQRIGNIADFELWRVNGYPSTQLLKLMRDVVSGLAHLHEIGIIHRDLKPQNVLIVKEKSMCAKLSDMGISKRLDGDMTSLSQHATGLGSSGWRAPEQLKNGRQTRALDLFSLGCLIFFCMTGGRHPFGDTYERDANIVNDQKDLFLVDSIPEALHLITHLLDPNPDLRPKAVEILHHPLFWNSDTRLSFLRDASDRVELEDRECESQLLKSLESVAPKALGGKWDEKLDNSFLDNIGRYRKYKYDSVRDLLRVVRNKLNHYRELPKDIQEALGAVPEGFDHYFTSRFPRLLMEVYKVIRVYCEGEELLSKYFKSTVI